MDWFGFVSVMAVAIGLRVVFYTGFFGSDEVTYVETAAKIASGDWRASVYVGATRYGMNLPVALSIALFGLSEASANLWPFLCSVGEVALVFAVARRLWSTRTAVLSSGMLALLPLHVHFAGRMMADSPLAFFLTLSVALLVFAVRSRSQLTFLAAGLAWGGVFWVKESVGLLYLPVFLVLSAYLCSLNRQWLWLLAGMGMAFAANCGLMYLVAGNPMYLFAVMRKSLTSLAAQTVETSPWYYLRYLFVNIRHTFLLGFLGAAGVVWYMREFARDKHAELGAQFLVLWLLLMTGMFSFAVVSVAPVQMVMKQVNYMLIFCGPMTLLAGWFVASLPRRSLLPFSGLLVCGSLLLAAFEQQAIKVFTANSRAAYVFLRDNPGYFLFGTTNNGRAVDFFSMMEGRREVATRFLSFGDLAEVERSNAQADLSARVAGKDVFASLDLQTIDWGSARGNVRRLADVPQCWTPIGALTPEALGSGRWLVRLLLRVGSALPAGLTEGYFTLMRPVSKPEPAYLFKVSPPCMIKPARQQPMGIL